MHCVTHIYREKKCIGKDFKKWSLDNLLFWNDYGGTVHKSQN